jgi:hypothetical protein
VCSVELQEAAHFNCDCGIECIKCVKERYVHRKVQSKTREHMSYHEKKLVKPNMANDYRLEPDNKTEILNGESQFALVSYWKIEEGDYECQKQYFVKNPVFLDQQ